LYQFRHRATRSSAFSFTGVRGCLYQLDRGLLDLERTFFSMTRIADTTFLKRLPCRESRIDELASGNGAHTSIFVWCHSLSCYWMCYSVIITFIIHTHFHSLCYSIVITFMTIHTLFFPYSLYIVCSPMYPPQ
jgi:hypothetical protein